MPVPKRRINWCRQSPWGRRKFRNITSPYIEMIKQNNQTAMIFYPENAIENETSMRYRYREERNSIKWNHSENGLTHPKITALMQIFLLVSLDVKKNPQLY